LAGWHQAQTGLTPVAALPDDRDITTQNLFDLPERENPKNQSLQTSGLLAPQLTLIDWISHNHANSK
jgi:hypothetical protein